jgi:uncharacterized membrane protein HdeD (DUF308 family)
MNINKKLSLIYIIAGSFIVFLVNGILANDPSSWSYKNTNTVSVITNIIILISGLLLIVENHKSTKKVVWYIIGLLFIVISLMVLITVNSVSNFGF